jgi:hypothetical protein
MFLKQAIEGGALEMRRGERIGGEEQVMQHGAEGGAELVADGEGEAHFFAAEDPGR